MSVSKIEAKIKDLEQAVQAYNKNNIKLSANGGNSMYFNTFRIKVARTGIMFVKIL